MNEVKGMVKIMKNKFSALEQLFNITQTNKVLQCTDLLGRIIKCTFEWNSPINIDKLKALEREYNLRLPEGYERFLLMSNGAILYNDDEDSGYQLFSLEDAIRYTKEKRENGYDGLKDEWLIFMVNLFDSDKLLFDMSLINEKHYILDGVSDDSEEEWEYLKWDFNLLMNLLYRANGDNFWRW